MMVYFKRKIIYFVGLLHFGPGWLPEREEHFPPQRYAVSPHVFCSSCLSSSSSSAPATVGCLSPLPPLITRNPPLTPCAIPSSCKPEGTAVSAVSCRCQCSFQGCSEDAEEKVCWVLNSSRSGTGGMLQCPLCYLEQEDAAVSIPLFDAPKPLPRGFAISCSVRSLLQDPALSPAEPQLPGMMGEERGQR